MAGLAVLLIGLLTCDVTGASRILLLSMPHRGIMMYFMEAGEALQKAGHEVYMVVSESVTPKRYLVTPSRHRRIAVFDMIIKADQSVSYTL